MHTRSALAALLVAAQAVCAFKGTYPLVAGSSERLSALSQLSPSSSTSPTSRFSSNQQTFSATEGTHDDLCTLNTLAVLAAPGLHYSDLALFPSRPDSPAGLNSLLAHFDALDHGHTLTHPYVSAAKQGRPDRAYPAAKLVKRFVRECGARVEVGVDYQRNVWADDGKVVRLVSVEGLDQLDLVGKEAREHRREIIHKLDAAFAASSIQIESPYAVLLSSFPPSFISSAASTSLKQAAALKKRAAALPAKHRKRQYTSDEAEEEYVEELLDEIAKEDALDDMIEKMEELEEEQAAESASSSSTDAAAPLANEEYAAEGDRLGVTDVVDDVQSSAEDPYLVGGWDEDDVLAVLPYQQEDGGNNGTSIFQPKEGAGLLHRYVFFTPALIFSFLVTLLVLIPAILVAVQALTAVETVQGLETKMVGSVGLDPSKQ